MTRWMMQRWMPVVILAAVCGFGLAAIAWSLIATFVESHEAIVAARQRLDELALRRIDPAALAAHRSRLEAVSGQEAGLLSVPTEAEVPGRLEASLRKRLQARSGQILLMRQVGSLGTENGAKFVRASIDLRIPEDQVVPILADLEAGTPTVFFEEVHLHRLDSLSRAETGRLEVTGTMRVYLDIEDQQERKS